MKDYYYLLGLKRNASDDEIKKAYRKLSKKFHPDVNDGDLYFTERFKDIQEAYEILSDPLRKINYDNISTNKSAEPKAEPPLPNPEIVSFIASTSRIKIGESITFSWNTINSAAVNIEPFGSVDLSGKITYKINGAKSNVLKFTLRVVGKNKTICSKDISVQVYEEPVKYEKNDYNYDVPNVNKPPIMESIYNENVFIKFFLVILDKIILTIGSLIAMGLFLYIIHIFWKILMIDAKK